MRVNLADVIDAIDTINEDETYFYSIQDEEIVYALEDDEDDEFFIPLPTKEEVNDYQNMVNFTETIEDDKKRVHHIHQILDNLQIHFPNPVLL